MTKQAHAAFQKNFNSFFSRNQIQILGSANPDSEPYFSWRPCGCCGSRLGGNREDYIGCNPGADDTRIEVAICSDCVYFNEYGQLDDMTMLDMEKEEIYA